MTFDRRPETPSRLLNRNQCSATVITCSSGVPPHPTCSAAMTSESLVRQRESGYSSNKALTSSSSEDDDVGRRRGGGRVAKGGFGPGGVAAALRSSRGATAKCSSDQEGTEVAAAPPTERDVVDLLKLSFLLQVGGWMGLREPSLIHNYHHMA